VVKRYQPSTSSCLITSYRQLVHPVRVSFWLITAGAGLQLGQAGAAAWLLLRYDAEESRLAPWNRLELILADSVRIHLECAFVLALGLAVFLAGVALAVPRPTDRTRPVVGWGLLIAVLAILLGVVFSPDSALLADNEQMQLRLQHLLPLWFTVVSACVVTLVIGCAIAAVIRLGREAATEYYQRGDPTATWPGFTSWLDLKFTS